MLAINNMIHNIFINVAILWLIVETFITCADFTHIIPNGVDNEIINYHGLALLWCIGLWLMNIFIYIGFVIKYITVNDWIYAKLIVGFWSHIILMNINLSCLNFWIINNLGIFILIMINYFIFIIIIVGLFMDYIQKLWIKLLTLKLFK